MTKAILVWGAPYRVTNPDDYRAAFAESGQNYGNLLIGHGVRSILEPAPLLDREELSTPEEADERCRQVVIPAANFLWKDFDFAYMVNFLEKTHLPVTMIGVGAQTNDRTTSSPIPPNTLRLMKLVAERSAQIGVRGYYTAEVLAANGIHNVTVIGCPSLYSKRTPTIRIERERLDHIERLAVNLSRRVNRHSFHPDRMKSLENKVLALALALALTKDSTFIAQDELDELEAAANGTACPPQVAAYFDEQAPEAVSDYFRTKTRYFADIDAWSTFIRSQDASIGTRFHGNLMALINGVPALMIVHDSRTMEMCTLMGIPSLHVSDVGSAEPSVEWLEDRLKSARFDLFESSFAHLHRRYVSFLDANGVPHNLGGL